MKKVGFSTKAIHSGQIPDPSTGAIMTPVYQTSTYVQSSPGEFIDGYDYSRAANPTRTALEANLAALENAKYCSTFASGCAAMDAVLHLLSAGDHVILGDDVYGGTFRLADKIFKQLGVQYTSVNLCDLNAVETSINQNTKLLWGETPTNPLLKLIDIEGLSALCKKRNLLLTIDNTFATPCLQNPLDLGADIVCHSTTKYIGGHSDLIGGALLTNSSELADQFKFIQLSVGAVPSPWDCFLSLRSTKTLSIRMERHCQNAQKIAEFLENHPKVEKVIYPGLVSHPQHELAKKQMRGFGGIVTFNIKGGLTEASEFLKSVKLFSLAESLGGVESLIEHPAIMTHASIPKEMREAIGITDTLIRVSVGIEDIEDLVTDLKTALG